MAIVSANGAATPLSPNVIINGAFDFWQRGTSIGPTNSGGLLADRWKFSWNGSGTYTVSQQAFALGASADPGFEANYFQRFTVNSVGTSTFVDLYTSIEDVKTFAGQTVTFSFWAKADSARTVATAPYQGFGTGGSGWFAAPSQSFTIGTGWARYKQTFVMPGISGKTIGPGSSVNVGLNFAPASGMVLDLWGMQLELGSVATPFRRNANSLQGELAACQRYYWRTGGNAAYEIIAFGGNPYSSTNCQFHVKLPVTMRAVPSSVEYASLQANDNSWGATVTSLSLTSESGRDVAGINAGVSSGYTTNRPTRLVANNSTSGYLAFSAEL